MATAIAPEGFNFVGFCGDDQDIAAVERLAAMSASARAEATRPEGHLPGLPYLSTLS